MGIAPRMIATWVVHLAELHDGQCIKRYPISWSIYIWIPVINEILKSV